ncbi:SDR family NAD(P)-dependent oxidoreductase [Hymenobacter psychrotolerans]|uniref:NAD(P)-dependent dehydrogenase, short-chain alcohol dehydrogenase family n=1 Tax=Hymenobacter psychrotolerans DSM 18569 TaxID=1121959 RepID=A0A1M6TRL1_9BACT|nr:SDR family NAD(P)-dependent oxidoreductase [Hymenobacter psychrotolerans]SHK59611.1 NAD(P)-dependent dehydrogenase, short-chain alcohol dehydrogenase family [Hymenobacter psychrotolerans DSM 18569]
MDLQLTGKTALITGSTGGIGLAIARRLAAEGAAVLLTGRTEARVAEARALILQETPDATVSGVPVDFGRAEQVQHLLLAVPAVDILINNVGIFEPKPFADITDEDWLHFFEVNVLSGVRLSRQYFPQMLAAGWGRIVFVSSESGLQIPAEMIHYGTTETAQLGVARGLAELTAGTDVTVNSVLPGPTASDGVEEFLRQLTGPDKTRAEAEQEFFRDARPSSLLKRFITPDEIANMVAYLCSPLAAATNGASVRVDGGVIRSIG